MKNREIARVFDRIADALEIKGEIGFKVLAYRRAARALEDMSEDVADVAREERLQTFPGIGTSIAGKIEEFLETGRMAKLKEALNGVPEGLLELLEIQGVGGKTIHLMQKELGVKGLADLKKAIADGSLAGLQGMGEKKVENIRKAIETRERVRERISIWEATMVAEDVIGHLKASGRATRIAPAGSLRRMLETVGDIDILATGKDGPAIVDKLLEYPGLVRVLARGETKVSIIVQTEFTERQVDLRVVEDGDYGAALQYFTGSKAHNIKLRTMAKDKGLKISEYGVFRGTRRIAGRTEEDVYAAMGLPVIPPEMREDRGEIELALKKKLPKIVDYPDIHGDLHVHTTASEGTMTLSQVVKAAGKMGYAYVAVCDHSRSAQYAKGLTIERLRDQIKEIDAMNAGLKGFRLLKGSEVDILADGTLDFPDSVLEDLDFVVASIHSGFRRNVTERLVRAMKNPFVSTIAHPTGRLISGREGYDVDLGKVIAAARDHKKALELNAHYNRLDLNEFNLKLAREAGVRISIGTDTHHPNGLDMMRFGVGIARRAWLTKKDILNCAPSWPLAGKGSGRKRG